MECGICGSQMEADKHVFFDCIVAKRVWQEVGKEIGPTKGTVKSFKDWFGQNMEIQPKDEVN